MAGLTGQGTVHGTQGGDGAGPRDQGGWESVTGTPASAPHVSPLHGVSSLEGGRLRLLRPTRQTRPLAAWLRGHRPRVARSLLVPAPSSLGRNNRAECPPENNQLGPRAPGRRLHTDQVHCEVQAGGHIPEGGCWAHRPMSDHPSASGPPGAWGPHPHAHTEPTLPVPTANSLSRESSARWDLSPKSGPNLPPPS